MPDKLVVRRRDFDNDPVQRSFDIDSAATATQINNMSASLSAWLGGTQGGLFRQVEFEADVKAGGVVPSDQASLVLIIEMLDTGNSTDKVYLPIPDLTKPVDGESDPAWIVVGGLTVMNPAHSQYDTFKADIEAIYVSPDGNTATMVRGYVAE